MALEANDLVRILIGIICECIVFTACCVITVMIMLRNKKSKKPQLSMMTNFFILYALSIAASIVGKILTYIKEDYSLDKTEWGIFTNWSFSLGFIALSLYFQLEVSWQLFPPKIKNFRLFAQLGSIVLFLIIFAIPRHTIDGTETIFYPLKFAMVFIYVLAASLYYMIHSYKVYTFLRNKFLRRRIHAGLIFYGSIIFVFIFFMISSIYGIMTDIYYSWGYFISITFMMIAAISAYFFVKHGKESDRQEIDEELKKLTLDRKSRNEEN
ncbi:MAG: hypothetical protein EU530_04510 [Promethearchaeota archaeon]|nr:MAG: hypothetical protein EU530_04510 [Candidatus Lokiarchaeota archaeon]